MVAGVFLTEGSQGKHAVELPLLSVSDDVSGVIALLGAMEKRPPEVGLTQQAEHTQLPLDLQEGGSREAGEVLINIFIGHPCRKKISALVDAKAFLAC